MARQLPISGRSHREHSRLVEPYPDTLDWAALSERQFPRDLSGFESLPHIACLDSASARCSPEWAAARWVVHMILSRFLLATHRICRNAAPVPADDDFGNRALKRASLLWYYRGI